MAIVGLVLHGDVLLTGNQQADAQSAPRPNFVFVMTDDLDERSMEDLDGITEVMGTNGTTFKNAYVTYSLCCPSRATILTGQYPHNHDIIGNGLPEGGEEKFRLGPDQSTIATWLHDAGYRTKLVGKYMNSYNDLYVPPGWDEWYVMIGNHWNLSDPATGKMNDNGKQTTLGGHANDVFADKASDFITSSSTDAAPFFLLVGTKAPHAPPEVATRYRDTFTTTPLPQPLNFNEEDVSDKPQWVKSLPRLSQSNISNLQTKYRERLRSMLSVEDLLNQIILTLDQTGQLDNTYIFFTSDNGYHLGNHRLGSNKKTPYEEDIGVPLMVRGPGVPAGEVREQLVLNNDFAPTIADLAGASIPKPEEVDGSSFAPLLTNSPPSSWRTAFLEESWREGGTTVPVPTHKGVHTQDHMFVEYDTGEYELYDLVLDPFELQSKPRAGNEQLYSDLQTRLTALRTCSGTGTTTASCRAAEGFPDDTTDPQITITTPPQGATYTLGQSVAARYECTDADSGVASCEGPVADGANIDTSSAGTKTFTVVATNNAGNTNSVSHTYTVNAQTSCTQSGTSASETLTGTAGDDVLCGLGGNDTLQGGVGDDTLDGGTGTDTASYSASLTAVSASLATNSSTGEGSDTFLGVENLLGSSRADTLTGSDTDNTLTGGGGKDQVIGSGGADNLSGAGGDDTVNSRDGVSGNDTLKGGAGTDTKVTDATEKSITGFP
jgi:arylsulfatase A-like enzyme